MRNSTNTHHLHFSISLQHSTNSDFVQIHTVSSSQLTPPQHPTTAPQPCSFLKSTSSPHSSLPPSPLLPCQKAAFPTVAPVTILYPVATAEPARGSQPPFGPCWSAEPTPTSQSRAIAIHGILSVSRMVGAAHMERPSSAPTSRRALCQGAMLELVRRRHNLFG